MRLPEFRLVAEPIDAEAERLTYRWSDLGIGTRHKIGGTPDFIQGEVWPMCRECGEPTTFYGQLDSLADKDGHFDIADCGMVYVFLCFDCNKAATVVQSY